MYNYPDFRADVVRLIYKGNLILNKYRSSVKINRHPELEQKIETINSELDDLIKQLKLN